MLSFIHEIASSLPVMVLCVIKTAARWHSKALQRLSIT